MENKNTPGETPDLGSARRDLEQAYDDPDADFSIERVEEILKPNVSEEKLKAFLEEICSDQQIKSYEELTAHNFAQFQMERLKREVHQKSVEDRGDLAYRAMYEATPSRRIRAQLLRMNEYALRKAEFEKLYGLKADPELERATAQYMAALAKTLRARVVLGNLRILAVTANQKKQKLDPVVLEQAIASLPTRIDGRAQRVDENDRDLPRVFSFTEADKRALQKASPEQIIANATLVDATAQLNTDIGWLLEANADVPGVLPGADGVLPADVMLMDLLARAIEENVKQVNDHPKDKVYRNERIAHRQKIISQIHFLRRTMGENKIQTITDLNLHEIFNRTFDDKASEPTESEPFDYAKMREHMDGELHKSVRGFREHKIEMMGEDGKGGVLEETPKVALEHFFNHEYRQKVIFPVMDGIVTMRLSVRRLLGKLPIIWDGQEVGEGRKEILEELKEEMGFPDTVMVNGKTEEFDPYNSKHWDALSQEQLTVIAQKMISTKDVLDTMRPKIVEQLRKVDDDMLVLEDLRLRAHPDELIGVDVDEELLGNMQRGAFDVNSQNIDALIQGENGEVDRGKLAAVYLGIQFQMNRHWEAYSETMYQFDSGMVRVADRHNEMSTVYRDTLDKVPWPWLEAMLAGLVAWYGVSVLRSGDPRNPMNWLRGFRRMGQDIRYVYRKGKWVVEKGVEGGRYVYRKGPPAIRNLYRRGREAGEWVYRENKWVREKRTGWPQAMNSQEIRTLKQSMTPEMRYAFAKRLLERTGDLTQAEKDLIKLVHEHGAIDPETGRWPRNVLEEKLRMLTEGTEGARFTKEEARTLLRKGICGLDSVEEMAQAARLAGKFELADDLVRVGLQEARALQFARGARLLRWGANAIPVVDAALSGYILQQSVYEYRDAITYRQDATSAIHKTLTQAGFAYNAKENTFVKGEVVLNINEDVLDAIVANKFRAAEGRVAADSVLPVMAIPMFFMGWWAIPVGVLISGGVITVRMNVLAKEKKEVYEFIQRCEPWLLAYMGTSIAGFHEGELLETEIMDLLVEEPSLEVREKILFSVFAQVLKRDPKKMYRITGGDFSPESLNTFFEGDFKSFVLPAFSLALFTEQSGTYAKGIPFSEAKNYQFQSARAEAPNARPKDVFIACNKALELYEQKLMEERFITLTKELQIASEEGRTDDALQFEEMLRELGKETIYGKSLFEVSDEIRKHDAKRSTGDRPETRMDLILKALTQKLTKNQEKSYAEMFGMEADNRASSPLRVAAKEIGWEGSSIPELVHAVYLGSTLEKALDYKGAQHLFERSGFAPEKTGSMLSKIDPDFHARMLAERAAGNPQPYERMMLAWRSPSMFVEIGTEGGKRIFGCSRDGKEMMLIALDGNKMFSKKVQKGEREPAWKSIQMDWNLSWDKQNADTSEAMSYLAFPNEYDDRESVRRVITLFSEVKDNDGIIEQLSSLLGTIPSGEIARRTRFLSNLQHECQEAGLIRHQRNFRDFIVPQLKLNALRGWYGEAAQRSMPKIKNTP